MRYLCEFVACDWSRNIEYELLWMRVSKNTVNLGYLWNEGGEMNALRLWQQRCSRVLLVRVRVRVKNCHRFVTFFSFFLFVLVFFVLSTVIGELKTIHCGTRVGLLHDCMGPYTANTDKRNADKICNNFLQRIRKKQQWQTFLVTSKSLWERVQWVRVRAWRYNDSNGLPGSVLHHCMV